MFNEISKYTSIYREYRRNRKITPVCCRLYINDNFTSILVTQNKLVARIPWLVNKLNCLIQGWAS
jgi:hypothetical protein